MSCSFKLKSKPILKLTCVYVVVALSTAPFRALFPKCLYLLIQLGDATLDLPQYFQHGPFACPFI